MCSNPAISVELWGLHDQADAPNSFLEVCAESEQRGFQVHLGYLVALAPADIACPDVTERACLQMLLPPFLRSLTSFLSVAQCCRAVGTGFFFFLIVSFQMAFERVSVKLSKDLDSSLALPPAERPGIGPIAFLFVCLSRVLIIFLPIFQDGRRYQ